MAPNYLQGIKGIVALARNPGPDAIFDIVDGLRSVGGLEARVIRFMREMPESAALMDERFDPPRPDAAALARLPEGSLGKAFADYLTKNGLDAAFYREMPIRSDGSYVAMRMRRTHDVWHVVTGFDTDVPGELGLQAFVLAQLHTPLATIILSTMLTRTIWKPGDLDRSMDAIARGWQMGRSARPLFAQKWELGWERPLDAWRDDLRVSPRHP
jgi:ubiquinone biosynthesis protein Coq4